MLYAKRIGEKEKQDESDEPKKFYFE